jgi:hypothetical protein
MVEFVAGALRRGLRARSLVTTTARQTPRFSWLGEYPSVGEVIFRLGRTQDELVAEWPGICTLRANRAAGTSTLTPVPGADPVIIEKVHRGLAQALLRHLAGKLTLHASAVAFAGSAVACLGESEAGKSTTMASLAQRRDAELVADDTLAIEFVGDDVQVLPTETLSWLRPEAHASLGHGQVTTKSPVSPPRAAIGASSLVALAKLTFDETASRPQLRRLRGHGALSALVPGVVRFILDEQAAHVTECEQLSVLVRAVPLFELIRKRDLASLAESADLLFSLLERDAR